MNRLDKVEYCISLDSLQENPELPVEEKAVVGLPGIPQRGPERSPKVVRELPSQKAFIFGLDLLLKLC